MLEHVFNPLFYWTGAAVVAVLTVTALITLLFFAGKLWLSAYDVWQDWQIPGFKELWAGNVFRATWGPFMDQLRKRYEAGEFSEHDAKPVRRALLTWFHADGIGVPQSNQPTESE